MCDIDLFVYLMRLEKWARRERVKRFFSSVRTKRKIHYIVQKVNSHRQAKNGIQFRYSRCHSSLALQFSNICVFVTVKAKVHISSFLFFLFEYTEQSTLNRKRMAQRKKRESNWEGKAKTTTHGSVSCQMDFKCCWYLYIERKLSVNGEFRMNGNFKANTSQLGYFRP